MTDPVLDALADRVCWEPRSRWAELAWIAIATADVLVIEVIDHLRNRAHSTPDITIAEMRDIVQTIELIRHALEQHTT